jgi:hypothetical protein
MKEDAMSTVTRLIVDLRRSGAVVQGADGYVLDPADHRPEAFAVGEMVLAGAPDQHQDWLSRPNTAWLAPSLGTAIRLRDRHPGLTVLPAVTVTKAAITYSCGDAYPGEGFRCYVPNTAALRGYQVSDGEVGLVDWLHRALSCGFEAVWLASGDAETRGRGFDLEMLERAHTAFPGRIWLSGGARTLGQVERLREEGGTHAAVLPADLLEEIGTEALLAALGHPVDAAPPADVPLPDAQVA